MVTGSLLKDRAQVEVKGNTTKITMVTMEGLTSRYCNTHLIGSVEN